MLLGSLHVELSSWRPGNHPPPTATRATTGTGGSGGGLVLPQPPKSDTQEPHTPAAVRAATCTRTGRQEVPSGIRRDRWETSDSSKRYCKKTSWNSAPPSPPPGDHRPALHECGSTKGPIGTPRVHKKTVRLSGKAQSSPTLRAATSRAKPRSSLKLSHYLLIGSAGLWELRTQCI